jgi:hypothetical protein
MDSKKLEKIQNHITNVSEMLNMKIYSLIIEFADMRNELKQIQKEFYDLKYGLDDLKELNEETKKIDADKQKKEQML